jgi:hypothetical protein
LLCSQIDFVGFAQKTIADFFRPRTQKRWVEKVGVFTGKVEIDRQGFDQQKKAQCEEEGTPLKKDGLLPV